MRLTKKIVCEKCDVRIQKNWPRLTCSQCTQIKHFKCQNLSKSDAQNITECTGYEWICRECFSDMLPINACNATSTNKNTATVINYKMKCQCCGGLSYSPKSIRSCPWCDRPSHIKCLNSNLGCNTCCEDMIPGFHAHNFELFGNIGHTKSIFNPYSRMHNSNRIGDSIANEEDNSNWNDISQFLINCKYKQPKNIAVSKKNELNVLSLNIRSIAKNLQIINDNITDYQKYDIICLNETNCNIDALPNGMNDLLIEGFHQPIIQAPIRKSCRGGGLATYVHTRVCSSNEIEKMAAASELQPGGEFLFVKLKQCKGDNKSVIIGNVYRSPSHNPSLFNELLESVLQKLGRHKNKHIVIVGDFNTDLIKHDNDINSQNLINTTTNHGFVQIISRPTRVTDHTATLIDHIYTNKIENLISSSIVTLDISDHLATLAKFSLDSNPHIANRNFNLFNNAEHHEFRLFNAANDEKFKQLIADECWEIEEGLDAQSQYDKFIEIYTEHYNTAYPLTSKRTRRLNERLLPKPWILPWLEEACDRKNRLYHIYVKNPTIANKTKYTKMKKFTDKHIKLAKSKYYKKYFEQYKDNSKKQWQMMNNLLNRGNKNICVSKLQDNNGVIINTPHGITEKFNEYFANIASNLKSNSGNSQPSCEFENFMTNSVPNSMYLRPVAPNEVYEIINNMKNKATLDTRVSALKIANNDIKFTQIIAKIITSSFEQGIFPQSLKLARVVPIFKSGSKADVSNYRPISLLTSFSKIYEKLMHNRVVNFMEANNSLYEMQYGFRSGRSCEHALLKAQSILLDTLNKKQIGLLLFIDFSKAFDMVEHSILLKKLSHYGIRGTALNWFKSYLDNREQFVSVNGTDSTKTRIKYGVPQGSILGPLLFVIYINDIPEIAKFAKFILYADDANIILTGQNMNEIHEQLSELTTVLLKWVNCNGLKLNLKKTNYMIFSRQKIDNTLNIVIANTQIHRKTESRFLGVIIDEKLTWSQHITSLKSKMSRYVGILYKIKHLLPMQSRLQIFHSFVQSHINFCSIVWGFSCKSNIDSLFTIQKKGMRAVMPGFVNFFYNDGVMPTHTKPAFSRYDVLTVQGVIAKNALIFMHKLKNFPNSLPLSVLNTVIPVDPLHDLKYELCQDWLDKFGTLSYRKSIFFKGPLLSIDPACLQLSTTIKKLSIKAYKNEVKRMLLDIQTQGNADEWQVDNFLLYNIAGLRKSARINR